MPSDNRGLGAIGAAIQSVTERQQAERAAQQAAAQAAGESEQSLSEVRSTATRFKSNKLEKLFREIQRKLTEEYPEYSLDGDYIELSWADGGIMGQKLRRREDQYVSGTVNYSIDRIKIEVRASGPTKSTVYEKSLDFTPATFSESAAVDFFNEHVEPAIAALISSGQLEAAGGIVRPNRSPK